MVNKGRLVEKELKLVFRFNDQILLRDVDSLGQPVKNLLSDKAYLYKNKIIKTKSCFTKSEIQSNNVDDDLKLILNESPSSFEMIVSVLSPSGIMKLYRYIIDDAYFKKHISQFLQVLIDMNVFEFPQIMLNDLLKRGLELDKNCLVKLIKILLMLGKFEQAKLCFYMFMHRDEVDSNCTYGEKFIYYAICRIEKNKTLCVSEVYPLYIEGKIDHTDDESPDLVMALVHELFLVGRFNDCLNILKELLSICQQRRRWVSLYYGYFLEILCLGFQGNYDAACGRYDLYSLLPHSTRNMQHMLDIAMTIVSYWCCKQQEIDSDIIERISSSSHEMSNNAYSQIYTLYTRMLIEITSSTFSISKFINLEQKIEKFYQYNQIKESWNIPDFGTLYEVAKLRDEKLKIPESIKQSFIGCFYQQALRDYVRGKPSNISPPIFFTSIKRQLRTSLESKHSTLNFEKLTNKEMEVALYLKKGYTYLDISEYLNISINTVKTHANNIYKKLKISGKSDLIS
ncbi:helix-turn-helix domain-containing protein [Vibrio cholerae]|uniref:helix-turn-helix domain-containing protein n=1 Tax=Vibrio cholerae TaxID=666 RepID=UPI00068E8D04|nr:helix-turn-helix transcriptional regulator [Vibrio cholerae]